MQCRDIMDRSHPIISVGAPAATAQRLFAASPVSFLPVCKDNGEFVTILDRDAAMKAAESDTIAPQPLPDAFAVLHEDDDVPASAQGKQRVVVVTSDRFVVGTIDPEQGHLIEEAMRHPSAETQAAAGDERNESVEEIRSNQGAQVDRLAQIRGGEGAPLKLREFQD